MITEKQLDNLIQLTLSKSATAIKFNTTKHRLDYDRFINASDKLVAYKNLLLTPETFGDHVNERINPAPENPLLDRAEEHVSECYGLSHENTTFSEAVTQLLTSQALIIEDLIRKIG